jgi:hypothetical protein
MSFRTRDSPFLGTTWLHDLPREGTRSLAGHGVSSAHGLLFEVLRLTEEAILDGRRLALRVEGTAGADRRVHGLVGESVHRGDGDAQQGSGKDPDA